MKIIFLAIIGLVAGLMGTAQAIPAPPPGAEYWILYKAPCSSGDATLGDTFCVSLHGSGQTAPTVIPLIPLDASAGGTWTGTTASCGTPPAVNPIVQGSGFTEQVAAILDTPSEAWVEGANYTVGVAAFNGDPAFGGLSKVTFWLCGNTQAATLGANARTGLYDWNLNIASTDQHNGDAFLYVYATPVNGYERRIGPFHFVLNNSGVATLIGHTHWYLDPVSGVDPTLITQCTSYGNASPTPTPAHLFKHFNWAGYCAAVENSSLGGGIIHVRAGTDYEDGLTVPAGNVIIFNQRTVTVQPDTGVADGAYAISLTCRNGAATISGGAVTACATAAGSTWNPRIWKLWFKGTTIDTGQIVNLNCGGVNCFWTASDNSAFTDRFGPGGPMVATSGDGDPLASAGGTSNGYHATVPNNFTFNTNQHYSIVDSTVSNYLFAGAQLLRNVTASISFDFSSMQGPISCSHSSVPRCGDAAASVTDVSLNSSNSGIFKTTATQPGPFKASHVPANSNSVFGGPSCTVNSVATNCVGLVTVSSIAINTPLAGQYTINWSGSPGLDVKAAGQPNEFLEMTSGTCAGYSNRLPLVSETASATVVAKTFGGYTSPCNPASINIADTGFSWLLAHPDCGQVIGQLRSTNLIEPNPNLENVIFQQYQCTGASMQELFPQTGPQNITFTGPSTMSVSGTTLSSDTLTAASVSGSTVTWSGTPTLLTSGSGSGYSSRYKISGGPLAGQIFTVSSQNNAAHTTTFSTSVSNLCGGGACSGVTANATLETIAGNFFNKCTPIASVPTNCVNSHSAAFLGSISGNTLSVNSSLTGTVAIGQTVYGVGITGNPTIASGSGSTWTISGASQGTIANEAITAGLSNYEYSRVVSTPTSSLDDTTATLDHAFSTSPIVSGSFSLVRSIKDWMIVSSFISSTDTDGQIQNGSQHFALMQDTFWGVSPAIAWRGGGNFATQDTSIFDTIFTSVGQDAGPSVFPGQTGSGNLSNNVIQAGTLPTGATVVGGLVLGTDGKPSGGTLNGHTLGHTPIFPRSLSDQVLTSSSLVGAQQP